MPQVRELLRKSDENVSVRPAESASSSLRAAEAHGIVGRQARLAAPPPSIAARAAVVVEVPRVERDREHRGRPREQAQLLVQAHQVR